MIVILITMLVRFSRNTEIYITWIGNFQTLHIPREYGI